MRESNDGFDGTWVAHPDLVPVATEVFDAVLGERPNQVERQRPEVDVTVEELLDFQVDGGEVTDDGLRTNVSVGVRYLDAWLNGVGAAAIDNLMEDVATAEISRAQIWSWVNAGHFDAERVRDEVGQRRGRRGREGRVRESGTGPGVRGVPDSSGVRSPRMSLESTKADEIALVIEQSIVSGELLPGTVLRQEQLSERFAVSRTPVREALRRLAALGLVSFEPNRGVRVRTLSREELREAFLVRAELESLATELAAPRMTEADLDALERAEAEFSGATQALRARSPTRRSGGGSPPTGFVPTTAFTT